MMRHLPRLPGEKHPSSKLTDAQRREIVARMGAGERAVDLAPEYGVTPVTIRHVYQRWVLLCISDEGYLP